MLWNELNLQYSEFVAFICNDEVGVVVPRLSPVLLILASIDTHCFLPVLVQCQGIDPATTSDRPCIIFFVLMVGARWAIATWQSHLPFADDISFDLRLLDEEHNADAHTDYTRLVARYKPELFIKVRDASEMSS